VEMSLTTWFCPSPGYVSPNGFDMARRCNRIEMRTETAQAPLYQLPKGGHRHMLELIKLSALSRVDCRM